MATCQIGLTCPPCCLAIWFAPHPGQSMLQSDIANSDIFMYSTV